MCTCIKDAERAVEEKESNGKGGIIATMIGVGFSMSGGPSKTTSEMKVKREGKKREERITIVHSYCPLCGKAY